MVRWVVVAAVALGLLAAPPVGQALENALLAVDPGWGRHSDGGLIQVTLYRERPVDSPDARTCYSVSVEPGNVEWRPGQPTDDAGACTYGERAEVFVQTPHAHGTLVVNHEGQTATVPYTVPKGMSASVWVEVDEGQLKVGVPPGATLTPLADSWGVAWAGMAAVGFLAILVAVVARVHPLVTSLLVVAAWIVGGKAWGADLPTAPAWALGLAACIFLASNLHRVKIKGRAPPPAPLDLDMPRLDAIGLREDLR